MTSLQLAAKLVLVASNCQPVRRSEIDYYALLSKTPVHHYSGNNVELGTACGKYFTVSVLAITDAGKSQLVVGSWSVVRDLLSLWLFAILQGIKTKQDSLEVSF